MTRLFPRTREPSVLQALADAHFADAGMAPEERLAAFRRDGWGPLEPHPLIAESGRDPQRDALLDPFHAWELLKAHRVALPAGVSLRDLGGVAWS